MNDDPTPGSTVDSDGPEGLPSGLPDGKTILVAGPEEPTSSAFSLGLLATRGRAGDRALVITASDDRDGTVESYLKHCDRDGRPTIGIVDTVSKTASTESLYQQHPTVYVPSPGDRTRLMIALSTLHDRLRAGTETQHLVIRSLTPFLTANTVNEVTDTLDRIVGYRTADGMALIGVDYTTTDDATLGALGEIVDGILWIAPSETGDIDVEFTRTVTDGRLDH